MASSSSGEEIDHRKAEGWTRHLHPERQPPFLWWLIALIKWLFACLRVIFHSVTDDQNLKRALSASEIELQHTDDSEEQGALTGQTELRGEDICMSQSMGDSKEGAGITVQEIMAFLTDPKNRAQRDEVARQLLPEMRNINMVNNDEMPVIVKHHKNKDHLTIALWREIALFFRSLKDAHHEKMTRHVAKLKERLDEFIESKSSHYFREARDGITEDVRSKWQLIKARLKDSEGLYLGQASITDWLFELRGLAYEAEDLLDLCKHKEMAMQIEDERVPCLEAVKKWFFHTVKEILFDIEMRRSASMFRKRFAEMDKITKVLSITDFGHGKLLYTSTGSTPATELVGRDSIIQELKKMLLADHEASATEVIAVVGMGGVGKTILCQHIFHEVRKEFTGDNASGLVGWVHVGENFKEVVRMANDILAAFTDENVSYSQLNQPQERLQKVVQGKRFLLVMDDVWNLTRDNWDKIQAPLNFARKGSKILITTRNKEIAQVAKAREFNLGSLSEEDGWSLFNKRIASSSLASENLPPEFRQCIFDKCGGLPLAVEVVGDLLRRESDDVENWINILNTDWWKNENFKEDILKPLCLTYQDLPPHLKSCFRFFSLFKKGEVIPMETLTELWIANSLFSDAEDKVPVYVKKLVSRSILEFDTNDCNGVKMHGLTLEVARFLSGSEFCNDHFLDTNKLPIGARHLSLHGLREPDDLWNAWLRTLLIQEQSRCNGPHVAHGKSLRLLAMRNGQLMNLDCRLDAFKNLRALRIQDSSMKVIPESVYTLYNLRRLVLASCPITDVSDLIGNLKNLQHLDLSQTEIEKIPESVYKLTALQDLDLHDCKKLVELPCGLSKLTRLIHLPYFPLGSDQNHAQLRELKNLELKGTLHIVGLDCLVSAEDAKEANMAKKRQLQRLVLDFSRADNLDREEATKKHLQTLEYLQPHSNLKTLEIRHYKGVENPSWHKSTKCDVAFV